MAGRTRISTIPRFRTEAEEARFWDTHDSTAFLADLKPVKVIFPPSKRKVLVSLRIGKTEVALLRRIAARKGLGYGSLIRLWVTERLFEELPALTHKK